MRTMFAVVLMVAVLAKPAGAGETQTITDVKEIHVGQEFILDFPGNRVAAQRWRLIKSKSQGLELVDVDPIGWILSAEGSTLFGNNDRMRFRVLAKGVGQADLTFEHNYRGWANKYHVRWETIRIVIKPSAEHAS